MEAATHLRDAWAYRNMSCYLGPGTYVRLDMCTYQGILPTTRLASVTPFWL